MELSILCDCEVALIIINGGKKVFPYVTSDMTKTLAKYHELADTGHVLTNTDYEIINARHHDPPTPNSRPQRSRALSTSYTSYDEDGFYDQDSDEDEDDFPTQAVSTSAPNSASKSTTRRGKRGAVESPPVPAAKRRVKLKMEEDGPSAVAEPPPPQPQFSANGRPIRKSTIREPAPSTSSPSSTNFADASPASIYHMPTSISTATPPPTLQQPLMHQPISAVVGSSSADIFNNSFASARPTGAPYVSYPAYGLSYAHSSYGSPYLGAALPGQLQSSLFPNASALMHNGALGTSSSPSPVVNGLPVAGVNASMSGVNPTAATQNGSELNSNTSSNSTPSAAPTIGNPTSATSSLRKGNTGLSVMVPDAMKRTALISPLTPTLPLTGMGGILHSPTLTHPAFFPTIPSPSPTTAPSAFGAIFPPFNSTDFLSNSLLSHSSTNNPLASLASNLASANSSSNSDSSQADKASTTKST